MADLSFEDFAGVKAVTPEPGVKSIPAASGVSFEDFSGQKTESPYSAHFDKTIQGLKAVGGEAAAIADFFLSVPGFLVQSGAQLGGTVAAAARGVPMTADQRMLNPVTAYGVGREAGAAVGEKLMNPVKKVLDLFRSGEAYEQSKTTAGLSKLSEMLEAAGKWAEEKSGGAVSRDALPMLADTLMTGAAGLGGKRRGIDPTISTRLRENAEKLRTQAEADAKAETLSPAEFAARAPVQQQINQMLAIRSPAEQAAITRQRRTDVKNAFSDTGKPRELTEEEQGQLDVAQARGSRVYDTPGESIFTAEERLAREKSYAESLPKESEGEPYEVGSKQLPKRVGQAEVLRILQKPGHERSAEDLIVLRAARQEGKASPDAVALLASAGIGATLAAALSDDELRKAALDNLKQYGPLSALFLPALAHPSLGKAKELKEVGKSPKEIWQETGLFQGVDKHWRYEISDDLAKLTGEKKKSWFYGEHGPQALEAVLEHPELFEKHPELKNLTTFMTPDSRGGGRFTAGMFKSGPLASFINVWGNHPEAQLKTLTHEVQHAVQTDAGFDRGTNSDTSGYDHYIRSTGEVEARTAANRIKMTPEERKATPPWESYDVAEGQQIRVSPGKRAEAIEGSEDKLDAEILKRTAALNKHSAGNLAPVTPEEYASYKKGELSKGDPAYRTIEEAKKLGNVVNDWRARQRGLQEGKISQELVVGLTGLGLGGLFGAAMSDDPSGALLGALAGASLGLPGTRARIAALAKTADYGLGNLSTRIGNISEPLKLRAREYERRVLETSYLELHKVVPLMQELNKLPDSARLKLERAILTNDSAAIAKLMEGNVPLVTAWRETRNTLNDLGAKLQGHGRFKTMLDDYFPRLVKDVEGLKAALDVQDRTRLEQALLDGEKRAMKERGSPLSSVEQSAIINREIQGFRRSKGYQPGYAKGRGVDQITEAIQPFYHTASESLYSYIRAGVQDLELARFFGRDLVQTENGKQKYTNIEGSVGNLVGRELQAGKIDHSQAQDLIKMLQSRFQGGERSPNRLVQEVRNLGNLGLLGNVVSAVTQMSDTALAIYAQDFRSTLTAISMQLSGKAKLSAVDFGLANHVAEEFTSPTKTADWLNKMFKYSGFAGIDRFGKTTHINAALVRGERLSRTPGGVKTLEGEYGAAFGDEFPRLVADLKSGSVTPRVRSYLFSELSDMQPVSKLEMPQGYLDNPNGRLLYMLKSFMLKQADIARRDTYGEIKKGNVGKGLKNLTEYALILGISGAGTQMIQDWIMGRDVHFDAYDVMENALKTFGWGEYVRDKIKNGHPIEALLGMAVPPYKMMDDIIRRDPRAVQYIPILGKLFYSWELGGKESAEIARKKRTGEELSEEAKDLRREKRQKAREARNR